MLIDLLCAFAALMILLLGWIKVQSAARQVALAHPETGPFRLVGGGCGGHGHGQASDQGHTTKPTIPIVIDTPSPPDPDKPSSGCDNCDNTACKSLASTGNATD